MNILHLLSWFPTPEDPTLGNFCIRMVQSLPQDCRSVILTVGEGTEKKPVLHTQEEEGYLLLQYRVKLPRNRLLRKIRYLLLYRRGLEQLRRQHYEPDLIHLHVAYPLGIIARMWKKRYGYPYVLTEHWSIYQPQNRSLFKGKMKRSILRTGKQASMILPVSRNLQQCMESYGIRNSYRVIYNLADTQLFRLGHPQDVPGKKRMLHISTLKDEVKNFSGILHAVERLRLQRDDFELHVIHDYPAPEFEAYVRTHGLSDCVFFHGKKSAAEVAEAMASAHFFLLFSHFENLPCVLVEAFAAGLPVLATEVGGIAEIVSAGRGILVKDGDEEALLHGMDHLLDTAGSYDRQGIRDYALKTFSRESIGAQIRQAYLDALHQGK